MANTTLEQLLAQKLLDIMSQEQKDKIVAEYIQYNIFGSAFDGMIKDPARRLLADMVNREINTQLKEKESEITRLVSEVFAETMNNKSYIGGLLEERFIEKQARNILGR